MAKVRQARGRNKISRVLSKLVIGEAARRKDNGIESASIEHKIGAPRVARLLLLFRMGRGDAVAPTRLRFPWI